MPTTFRFDLLVSHRQIWLAAGGLPPPRKWLPKHIRQQAQLDPHCAMFDPILDGTHGAFVTVRLGTLESRARSTATRRGVVPFELPFDEPLFLGSATESTEVKLPRKKDVQGVVFEIFERDEIGFEFTLLTTPVTTAKWLRTDDYGAKRGATLWVEDRAHAAVHKGERVGLKGLKGAERVAFLIAELEAAVDLGFLDSYLDRLSARVMRETVAAFTSIGAKKVERALRADSRALVAKLVSARVGYTADSIERLFQDGAGRAG